MSWWFLLGLDSCTTPPTTAPTSSWQVTTKPPLVDTLTPTELALLQPGDVLLRRGYGLMSDYILAVLQEPLALTHCGLIVEQNNGQLGVLHTGSTANHEGVLVEPLTVFVQQSMPPSLVAVRPIVTPTQRLAILEGAHQYALAAAPFDYNFDDQDPQALYCVEMLRDLFLTVCHKDYLPTHYYWGDRALLGFQDFFDQNHFTLLFNHYLNAS